MTWWQNLPGNNFRVADYSPRIDGFLAFRGITKFGLLQLRDGV